MGKSQDLLRPLADGATIGLAVAVVGHLYLGSLSGAPYRSVIAVASVLWWGVSLYVGKSSARWSSAWDDILQALLISTFGGLLLTFLLFALKLGAISRFTIGVSVVASFVSMLAMRLGMRRYFKWLQWRGVNREYVMVVGLPDIVHRFVTAVARHPETGVAISSLVLVQPADQQREVAVTTADDSTFHVSETIVQAEEIMRLPPLIEKILHHYIVDEVIIGLPLKSEEIIEDIILRCAREGKTVRLLVDSFATRLHRYRIVDWYGQSVLSIGESEERDWQFRVKRLLDAVLSLLLLLLLLPILACIALAIRLDSDGPVLFVQERVGRNGRRFKCFKFRTMVTGADKLAEEIRRAYGIKDVVPKLKNDPRVTRVGRILRKFSLDELPQLWNVLRGDMSLVGPRPLAPVEVDILDPEVRKRLSVKPGLTCLWQIYGRSDVDWNDRMAMDLEYVDRWSLWLDLKILVRTIPAVLLGKGAY